MSEGVEVRAGRCTCEPDDPGGVDPGCPHHGAHPCSNGFRQPHVAGVLGKGCCAHCSHIEAVEETL
jgi:hypothetical protein